MKKHYPKTPDVESFNGKILSIDLEDVEVVAMEQRIELALASLFDGDLWDDPGGPPGGDEPCGQFSCNGYFPAA